MCMWKPRREGIAHSPLPRPLGRTRDPTSEVCTLEASRRRFGGCNRLKILSTPKSSGQFACIYCIFYFHPTQTKHTPVGCWVVMRNSAPTIDTGEEGVQERGKRETSHTSSVMVRYLDTVVATDRLALLAIIFCRGPRVSGEAITNTVAERAHRQIHIL